MAAAADLLLLVWKIALISTLLEYLWVFYNGNFTDLGVIPRHATRSGYIFYLVENNTRWCTTPMATALELYLSFI